eukprot:8499493-Karenia_brevis.AAC.1
MSDLAAPFNPIIFASDASEFGLGVSYRHLDIPTISKLWKDSERWRFQFEDAICARDHALPPVADSSRNLHSAFFLYLSLIHI